MPGNIPGLPKRHPRAKTHVDVKHGRTGRLKQNNQEFHTGMTRICRGRRQTATFTRNQLALWVRPGMPSYIHSHAWQKPGPTHGSGMCQAKRLGDILKPSYREGR